MARMANMRETEESQYTRESLLRPENERAGPAPTPHVLQIFQPLTGGVPTYVANLTLGLLARGWRVSVACDPAAVVSAALHDAGVEIVPLEVPRRPQLTMDGRAVRSLTRWCREQDVTVVHGHSTKAGMLAALTGRGAAIPSVYTPHGWAFEMHVASSLRLAYALFERQLALRYHAGIVTVSASGRAAAERWRVVPRGRIRVVRTGVPDPPSAPDRLEARRALGLPADAFVAAWVGRVDEQKRPADLAPIARGLAGHATIVALCEGLPRGRLGPALEDAGVVLAGGGCRPETVYAAADILLHTSDWEASPLVVLESMAAGLPAVAYSVGGVAEQIEDDVTGYLVRRGDIEAIWARVLELTRDPHKRARLGDAARERRETLFDHAAMLDQLTEIYHAVAAPATEPSAAGGVAEVPARHSDVSRPAFGSRAWTELAG